MIEVLENIYWNHISVLELQCDLLKYLASLYHTNKGEGVQQIDVNDAPEALMT